MIDRFGVECERRHMVAFELSVKRLQVRLLHLLPLIKQPCKWLSSDMPCLDLCSGWCFICIFNLLLDSSQRRAHTAKSWRTGWTPTAATAPSSPFAARDRIQFRLDRAVGCGNGRLTGTRLELIAQHRNLVDRSRSPQEIVVDRLRCSELLFEIG